MKKSIIILFAIVVAFTACNNKQAKETSDNTAEQSAQLYACPMHPEITVLSDNSTQKYVISYFSYPIFLFSLIIILKVLYNILLLA